MQMKVSIQGYKGSFHHIAATKHFEKDFEIIERDSFGEVFKDLETEKAEYGIIAIENTIAGSILTNLDLLLKYRYKIVGEVYLRIKHNLIAYPGQKKEEIKEVHSHIMALAQCEEYINEHNFEAVENPDTAGFAREISEKKLKGVAAIGSEMAAKIYGLEILDEEIEDHKMNFTRFWVISKKPRNVEDADKSSIMLELRDKFGSLSNAINIFAQEKVNLTKLESRPIIGRPWSYRFYIDLELDWNDPKGWRIQEKLDREADSIVHLGTYKKGEIPIN